MLVLLAYMRKLRLTRRDDGFTILELLVVMVVIAILAGISIPLFLNQSRMAVDAAVKSDVRNTSTAVLNWQRNHLGAVAASTTEYLAQNGQVTLTRKSDTRIGVVVADSGAYTVCAYDAGGNDYRQPGSAWAFNSANGKFDKVGPLLGAGSTCAAPTPAGSHSNTSDASATPVWATAATLPNAEVNEQYSRTLVANGTPAPAYELSSTSTLPAGLSLNRDSGVLSGKPTATGLYKFTILAKNTQGVAAREFTLRVATFTTAPEWNTDLQLRDGSVGTSYAVTLDAVGNPTPTYQLQAGSAFPAGLSMNATTGKITGAPTTAGDSTFTVLAKNSKGSTPRTFSIHVAAAGSNPGDSNPDPDSSAGTGPVGGSTTSSPTDAAPDWKSDTSLPVGEQGSAYSAILNADADPAAAYTLAAGSTLPAGLTLNKTSGMISGTPTVYGSFSFKVVAKNTAGSASRTFTMVLAQKRVVPAFTTGANLTSGEQGTAYSTTIAATGVPAPSFVLASASTLPAGLSLNNATGVISGTPSVYGTFSFSVTAANSKGSVDRTFNLSLIKQRVAPTFTGNAALPAAEVASSYSTTLTATGEPAPTFALANGSTLPSGLNLNVTSGTISGTPTTNGSFSFSVTASNVMGSVTRSYTVSIAKQRVTPAFTTAAGLADGEQNSAYSTTIVATGEPQPTLSMTSGSIPTGMSLNTATGVLSGTPSAYGSFTFTLSATNSLATTSRSFTLDIAKQRVTPVYTTAAQLPDAAQSGAYSTTIVATGEPAATYALATGSTLPSGLNLNGSTGVLSGTPTVYGSFTFTITASNSKGRVTRAFSLTIARQPVAPTFNTASSLPGGILGDAYATTLSTSGYPDPTFALTSGSLPAGLSLNTTTGAITGTPTATGTSTFTITATSSAGSANRTFTLQVTSRPVINTASLTSGVQGQSYSQTLSISGVPTPTASVSGLPAGVSYNDSTRTISGTPTAYGSFNVSVTATNSAGAATRAYTLTITGKLATPTNVRTTKIFGNQATLAWNGVTNATSYTVTLSGETDQTFTTSSTSSVRTMTLNSEYAANTTVSVVATASGYANSAAGSGDALMPGRRIGNDSLTAGSCTSATNVTADCALTSFDGTWTAVQQQDGNFVVYKLDLAAGTQKAFWATQKLGAGNRLGVQADANLVAYNSAGTALTATNSYPGGYSGGGNLAMGDAGDLKMRRSDTGDTVWQNISPVNNPNVNTAFMDWVAGSNVAPTNASAESDASSNVQWSNYYGPAQYGFSTEAAHSGSRSYKIVTSGNNPEGVINGFTGPASPGDRIMISMWVKGTAGEQWQIAGRTNPYAEGMGAYNFTTNGSWQLVNVLYTVPNVGSVGQYFIQLRQVNVSSGKTLYTDDLSIWKDFPG